jgi:hypothetical protein
MTLVYTYDGDVLTQKVKPSAVVLPQRAEMGEASFAAIPIEDPAAGLTMLGHRPFVVEESESTTQPRLFTGYTTQRDIGRSTERGLITGTDQRLQDTTLVDQNLIFNLRVISGTDGNRGEETWDTRLAWILESDYMDGLFGGDLTWIDSHANPMDAADYRGALPSAVFDDLVQRFEGSLNYFAAWNPDTSDIEIAVFGVDDTTGDCPLRVSNVESDVDGADTFFLEKPAKLQREPDTTYSEVLVNFAHGSVFRSRASTAATYIRRGTAINRPYTGKVSTAAAQAEEFLSLHASEVDRITCTMRTVPAASVGLVRAGQRMQVRFTHMPDYAAFTWMRIVGCQPVPTTDVGDWYDVQLELVARKFAPCDPAGTGPLALRQYTTTWVEDNENITTSATLSQAPVCGNVLVVFHAQRGGGMTGLHIDGYTMVGPLGLYEHTHELYAFYKVVEDGDTAVVVAEATAAPNSRSMWVGEVQGTYGLDDSNTTNNIAAPIISATVTPTAGNSYLLLSGTVFGGAGTDVLPAATPLEGATEIFEHRVELEGQWPTMEINYRIIADAAGSYDGGAQNNTSSPPGAYPWGIWPPEPGSTILLAFSSAGGGDTEIIIPPAPGGTTTHTTDPTVNDDASAGYGVGAVWVNTTSNEIFVNVDNADGAAIWTSLSEVGAPDTADYLVGTAQAGLSAEIVVGTTPGGELGGTWASPTVDATHAGSAHLALGSTGSTAAAGNHAHTGYVGELLISDTPSTPLVFADILQNEAEDDFLYAD